MYNVQRLARVRDWTMEHLARTNTGLLMKSTLMFPTKIVRKNNTLGERKD
jgi:hypothetical protein